MKYIKAENKLYTMSNKKGVFTFLAGLVLTFLLISFIGCQQPAGQSNTEENAHDFVSIFDGKTLDGWSGDTSFWHVKDGVIIGEETAETAPTLKANTFLIWQGGKPGDFELTAEYKISDEGNSGIQYRSENVEGVPYGLKGYQMDIDGANQYTGQNYEERGRTILAFRGQKVTLPPVGGPVDEYAKGNVWRAAIITDSLGSMDSLKALIKNNDWNKVHIIAKGNHLQHYINDVLMCDVTDNDTANRKASGLIGLQLHAGHIMRVEFRNIKIKQ